MLNASDLIKELMGTVCHCGKTKHAEHTFCGKCYFSLPRNMRKAIYNRIGNGYEEAYEAATVHLDWIGRT